jgi:type III pantothenate kinase
VVPEAAPVVVEVARRMFGREPFLAGPGSRTGMALRYSPPGALGTDRVLDAVAARELLGAPVIAVDFGTATTFNVVGGDGSFLGGAIAPGFALAAEAVVAAGARLHAVDLTVPAPCPLIGRTTEASVRSGALHGYAGLVAGLLQRMAAELEAAGEPPAPVVATGGMAAVVAGRVAAIRRVEPLLTLDGLRLVFGKAAATA